MNIEELYKSYETALSSVNDILADIQCKIKEFGKQEEEKPSRRFKPENEEIGYYINYDGDVIEDYWDNDCDTDKNMYAIGNCFKTKEEAEFAVEQLKVLAELKGYVDDEKKWNDKNKHWFLDVDIDGKMLASISYSFIIVPFNLYFSSKEQARKAIDAIGEDRLKKYYFCVEG